MTTFDLTFWDAGGRHEMVETIEAATMREALARAESEAEGIARTTGTAWLVVSVADGRFNSSEALGRVAFEGVEDFSEAVESFRDNGFAG
jgi:hypothetical protein